jgi:hypothetical protein
MPIYNVIITSDLEFSKVIDINSKIRALNMEAKFVACGVQGVCGIYYFI